MQKISKVEAARVWADEIDNMKTAVIRTIYISQEIIDDYFYMYDPHDEKDQFCILYDFTRRKAFAGVLEMCISEVDKALSKFEEARKEAVQNGEAQS